MNASSCAWLRQCNDNVTRIDFVSAIGPVTESPARNWVASLTTDVLVRTEAGVAANAAEPAAKPMATTRAFNRRLLGITELHSGREIRTAAFANTQPRDANPPCILPTRRRVAAKPCLNPCKQRTGRCVCGLPDGALTPASPGNVNKRQRAVTLQRSKAFSAQTASALRWFTRKTRPARARSMCVLKNVQQGLEVMLEAAPACHRSRVNWLPGLARAHGVHGAPLPMEVEAAFVPWQAGKIEQPAQHASRELASKDCSSSE